MILRDVMYVEEYQEEIVMCMWSSPRLYGEPPRGSLARRHTAVFAQRHIIFFGGGAAGSVTNNLTSLLVDDVLNGDRRRGSGENNEYKSDDDIDDEENGQSVFDGEEAMQTRTNDEEEEEAKETKEEANSEVAVQRSSWGRLTPRKPPKKKGRMDTKGGTMKRIVKTLNSVLKSPKISETRQRKPSQRQDQVCGLINEGKHMIIYGGCKALPMGEEEYGDTWILHLDEARRMGRSSRSKGVKTAVSSRNNDGDIDEGIDEGIDESSDEGIDEDEEGDEEENDDDNDEDDEDNEEEERQRNLFTRQRAQQMALLYAYQAGLVVGVYADSDED